MQRENIANLIHEQAHTHETQSLSFLLYFFSSLHQFLKEEVGKDSKGVQQLVQMLQEDFTDNQEFKEFCLHSNNEKTKIIYGEIIDLVSYFEAFGKDNNPDTLVNLEKEIQKIYEILKQSVEKDTITTVV